MNLTPSNSDRSYQFNFYLIQMKGQRSENDVETYHGTSVQRSEMQGRTMVRQYRGFSK
ncbi:MAG: hypothetical protein ACFBSE_03450 [Prochloraceae cyanobacterium]